MNIIKELEKLKYELEKNTYGRDHLGLWVLVDLLLNKEKMKTKTIKKSISASNRSVRIGGTRTRRVSTSYSDAYYGKEVR